MVLRNAHGSQEGTYWTLIYSPLSSILIWRNLHLTTEVTHLDTRAISPQKYQCTDHSSTIHKDFPHTHFVWSRLWLRLHAFGLLLTLRLLTSLILSLSRCPISNSFSPSSLPVIVLQDSKKVFTISHDCFIVCVATHHFSPKAVLSPPLLLYI